MTEPRDETKGEPAPEANATVPSTAYPEPAPQEPSPPPEVRPLAASLDEPERAPRLLEPSEIRARRRPRALFYVWTWELVCALLLATPMHAWAKAFFGTHPAGDAPVFTPGGYLLMSWLGDDSPSLAIVLRTTFLLLVVFGVLGQLMTGVLVASLATGHGERGAATSFGFALRAALRSFFPLLGIGVFSIALEAFFLGIGALASSAVDQALVARLGDARAFTARLVVLGLFAQLALLVGVVADLARVATIRDLSVRDTEAPVSLRVTLRDAAVSAASTARHALGRSILAWGWRAGLSLTLVWVGALAGDYVGAGAGGALWLLFFVHQAILIARAGLRASWLANALRLVSTPR